MKIAVALTAVLTLAFCASPARAQGTPGSDKPAATPASQPAGEQPKTGAAPAAGDADGKAPTAHTQEPALVYVKMTTSMGDIVIELNNEKAPLSTANFLSYVDKGFYDGTIFHRIIPNFMIQGGGFTPDMSQKSTGPGVKNEWKNGLKNVRGSVAMARTAVADSGTSQFFINVVDNGFLDQPRDGAGYAVFGKVVSGMDVVDKIKAVPTGLKNGMPDVPVDPVLIKSVKRTEAPAAAPVKKE